MFGKFINEPRKLFKGKRAKFFKRASVIAREELEQIAKLMRNKTMKVTMNFPGTEKKWFYGRFKNGFPQDTLFIYDHQHKNNSLRFKIYINSLDSWAITGKFVGYYEDGVTERISGRCYNGLLHGTVNCYRENGELLASLKYSNGFLYEIVQADNPNIVVKYDRKTAKMSVFEKEF